PALWGSVNADGLNALPPGYCDPCRYTGCPETKSGRTSVLKPTKLENLESEMPTGCADRTSMRFSVDHPLRSALFSTLPFGPGRSYVKAAENVCLRSKSDGPRSWLIADGSNALAEPKHEPADAA